jgi:hypothetical protein
VTHDDVGLDGRSDSQLQGTLMEIREVVLDQHDVRRSRVAGKPFLGFGESCNLDQTCIALFLPESFDGTSVRNRASDHARGVVRQLGDGHFLHGDVACPWLPECIVPGSRASNNQGL